MELPPVRGFSWLEQGIVWLSPDPSPGYRAAFVTRLGGLGAGLSLASRGVDREEAQETRRLLFAALGVSEETVAWAHQVHGARVAIATGPGRVADEADILITGARGLWLLGLYADCVPVVLVDREAGAISLAHAGWRGTAQRVGPRAITAMVREYDSRPDRIEAVIGPAIGECCYEVGPDVFRAVTGREVSGHQWLDLAAVNAEQLVAAGVKGDRIRVAGLCTSCNEHLFFSYRRSGGHPGRFAVVAALEE